VFVPYGGGTKSMNRRRTIVCLAVATALLASGVRAGVASASTFRPCHDDTKLSHHWTHGNPEKGLRGSESGDRGYYYLSITAGCSGVLQERIVGGSSPGEITLVAKLHLTRVVSGKIDSDGMCWRLDIDSGYDHTHKLMVAVLMGKDVTMVFGHARVGERYRLRVANLENGVVVTDHASFDG